MSVFSAPISSTGMWRATLAGGQIIRLTPLSENWIFEKKE